VLEVENSREKDDLQLHPPIGEEKAATAVALLPTDICSRQSSVSSLAAQKALLQDEDRNQGSFLGQSILSVAGSFPTKQTVKVVLKRAERFHKAMMNGFRGYEDLLKVCLLLRIRTNKISNNKIGEKS
jgi:hypothetical protein